jgi:hypothetical protein
MKTTIFFVAAFLVACTDVNPAPEPKITVTALNPVYVIPQQGSLAVVTFDLLVKNDSDVAASAGCGLWLEKASGNGFVKIGDSPCAPTAGSGTNIAAHTEVILRGLTKVVSASTIEEAAQYRVVISLTLGPHFKSGDAFDSQVFSLTRKQ